MVQGTLFFLGLVILLWVPLLIFSSGNPTYQVRLPSLPFLIAFLATAVTSRSQCSEC